MSSDSENDDRLSFSHHHPAAHARNRQLEPPARRAPPDDVLMKKTTKIHNRPPSPRPDDISTPERPHRPLHARQPSILSFPLTFTRAEAANRSLHADVAAAPARKGSEPSTQSSALILMTPAHALHLDQPLTPSPTSSRMFDDLSPFPEFPSDSELACSPSPAQQSRSFADEPAASALPHVSAVSEPPRALLSPPRPLRQPPRPLLPRTLLQRHSALLLQPSKTSPAPNPFTVQVSPPVEASTSAVTTNLPRVRFGQSGMFSRVARKRTLEAHAARSRMEPVAGWNERCDPEGWEQSVQADYENETGVDWQDADADARHTARVKRRRLDREDDLNAEAKNA
ncbi:hypothetical protein B0H16DRAFT_1534752 [Mycena metata]|uniref:Uncharacterized protein n=1 Tax=Mycena metata TaxID=1033252 RepID=A0AAD7J811_9AGAR|nr:hypothetical protein B0H16DRAFT_1534752 [Mycena metata]